MCVNELFSPVFMFASLSQIATLGTDETFELN